MNAMCCDGVVYERTCGGGRGGVSSIGPQRDRRKMVRTRLFDRFLALIGPIAIAAPVFH